MSNVIHKKDILVGNISYSDISAELQRISCYGASPWEFIKDADARFIIRDSAMQPNLLIGDYVFGIIVPRPYNLVWGYVHVVLGIDNLYLARKIFPVKGDDQAIELRSQNPDLFPPVIRKFDEVKEIYRMGPLVRNV